MPYVNIKVTDEDVTKEQKAKLIAGVTQLLVNTDNWGIGGQVVTSLRQK